MSSFIQEASILVEVPYSPFHSRRQLPVIFLKLADLLQKASLQFYIISQSKRDMWAILEQPGLLDFLCLQGERDNSY